MTPNKKFRFSLPLKPRVSHGKFRFFQHCCRKVKLKSYTENDSVETVDETGSLREFKKQELGRKESKIDRFIAHSYKAAVEVFPGQSFLQATLVPSTVVRGHKSKNRQFVQKIFDILPF